MQERVINTRGVLIRFFFLQVNSWIIQITIAVSKAAVQLVKFIIINLKKITRIN